MRISYQTNFEEEYCKLRDEVRSTENPDFKMDGKFIYRTTKFYKLDEDDDVPNSSHCGIAKTLEVLRRYF